MRWSLIESKTASTVDEPSAIDPIHLFEVVLAHDPFENINRVTFDVESSPTTVAFSSPVAPNGLQVLKKYSFSPSSFLFTLDVEVINRGNEAVAFDEAELGLRLGPGLGFTPEDSTRPLPEDPPDPHIPVFKSQGDITRVEDGQEQVAPISWAGFLTSYYALLVIPSDEKGFDKVEHVEAEEGVPPTIVAYCGPFTLAPGERKTLSYAVYAGPKSHASLRDTELGLEEVVFYGTWDWLAVICRGVQIILTGLNQLFHSWGVTIIVFAFLFRFVTLPLSLYGARQQVLMKETTERVKPEIEALKEKYKDDEVARDDAIFALYKEHHIGPTAQLKGCLPLMIQLPVLIALFRLFLNWYELKGAQFLWIGDLAVPDRLFSWGVTLPWLGSYFNLLPALMFGAQIVIARSMTVKRDQEGDGSGKAIYLMPIVMTLLFYPFPAGCMLFWTTGNFIQIFEQRLSRAQLNKQAQRG